MRVKLSPTAIEKIQNIYNYIADNQDNAPAAYAKIDNARQKAVQLIENNPYCGRDLDKHNAQFLTIDNYVFCWTIDNDEAVIFAIHGKGEDWRTAWE